MSQESFFRLLAHQLRDDLGAAPATVRQRISEAGRTQRCVNVAELRALARRRIPSTVFDYVDGAAGDELTAQRNESDLRRLVLLPRVLAGVTDVDLSTTVLGHPVAVPLLGAPTGMTGLVHHQGEIAVARAVHDAGGVYVLSSVASRTIEEVAQSTPGPLWFQLYAGRDRGVIRSMLQRARAAGYRALVVTVDVPRAGARERDRRNGFTVPPRVTARSLVQGVLRPRWSVNFVRRPRILSESALSASAVAGAGASLTELINRQFAPALSWNDIGWLQEQWGGPLVVKGVLRSEDAEQAARLGVAGVVVSNHGGRQLDRAPSSISVLPAVVDTVGSELEVYFDGGVRRGVDIVSALALGARACLSGRALLYGLAAGGQAGASRAVELLIDELRLAMTLLGCASVCELDHGWITTTPGPGERTAWSTG